MKIPRHYAAHRCLKNVASTYEPRSVEEHSGRQECQIVARVESVPERAEDEDGHCAWPPLIDDVPQPVRRRLVPVVQ